VLRGAGALHRLETEKVGLDRGRVGVGHVGIAGERHGRIQAGIAASQAFVNGCKKFSVAVIADACFRVRSDIGRVQGAERQNEGATAGIGRASFSGVTGRAIRCARQVFASFDEARVFEFSRDAGRILCMIFGQCGRGPPAKSMARGARITIQEKPPSRTTRIAANAIRA